LLLSTIDKYNPNKLRTAGSLTEGDSTDFTGVLVFSNDEFGDILKSLLETSASISYEIVFVGISFRTLLFVDPDPDASAAVLHLIASASEQTGCYKTIIKSTLIKNTL